MKVNRRKVNLNELQCDNFQFSRLEIERSNDYLIMYQKQYMSRSLE